MFVAPQRCNAEDTRADKARLKPFFAELALVGGKSERRREELRALSELGAGGFKRLHLAWEAMSDADAANDYYMPPSIKGKTARQASAAAASRRDNESAYGVYSGGWQAERRGAWTSTAQKTNSSFEAELVEAISQQYGWRPGDPPGPGSSEIAGSWRGQSVLHRNIETAFGIIMDRVDAHPNLQRAAPSEAASHVTSRLRLAARAPAAIMRIGGKVPYEMEHRLAMFCDRAAGGLGAWDS